MELAGSFKEFLSEIRLTPKQREDTKNGKDTLIKRLYADADLQNILVSIFLQGSYRRSTAVRPKNDARADVDIVVVTSLKEDKYTPKEAMVKFVPFLEKYYSGKWRQQNRSFGIEMSTVDMDLVITSAPSAAEEEILKSESVTTDDDVEQAKDLRFNTSWISPVHRYDPLLKGMVEKAASEPEWKLETLRIPDRTTETWEDTHPLEQIRWTLDKNRLCNGHFVNVVKSIKWWRLENYDKPEHPKGFPLERIVGECCPSNIESVAVGIVITLEAIVTRYQGYVALGTTPSLPDYGVPSHNVLHRITPSDFAAFYGQAKEGAALGRAAFDEQEENESKRQWRKLLGSKFPGPDDKGGSGKGGFTEPTKPAAVASTRFA